MKYYKAINTGHGFLTSEDRTGFTVEGKPCDIWVIEDNLHSEIWAERVGATEITQGKAEMLLKKFDLDHPDPILSSTLDPSGTGGFHAEKIYE